VLCLRDEWQWVSLSSAAPSGIPGDLPAVFSLAKYRGSAWWTKYFPRSCGIEIENNSESKESSAIGDSSRDSTEGSSYVELRQKTTIHSNFDIYTRVPSVWTRRFSLDPAGLRLKVTQT